MCGGKLEEQKLVLLGMDEIKCSTVVAVGRSMG